jgi:hypothetical protein
VTQKRYTAIRGAVNAPAVERRDPTDRLVGLAGGCRVQSLGSRAVTQPREAYRREGGAVVGARFIRLAVVGLVLVYASAVALPSDASAPADRCNMHEDHAVRTTATVLVYRVATKSRDGDGNPIFNYEGCLRPRSASQFVGRDDVSDGEYVSNLTLTRLVVTGPYAVSWELHGAGAAEVCAKYALNPCPSPVSSMRVVNLRSRTTCVTSPLSRAAIVSELQAGTWVCPPDGPVNGTGATGTTGAT